MGSILFIIFKLFILIVGEIGAKELRAFFIRVLETWASCFVKEIFVEDVDKGKGLSGGENGREWTLV